MGSLVVQKADVTNAWLILFHIPATNVGTPTRPNWSFWTEGTESVRYAAGSSKSLGKWGIH